MIKRKLQLWQPVTNLEVGQIVNANFSYTENGLYLTLIDINENEVEIIYNKMSNIQDYVWSFRYAGEGPRSDLYKFVKEALEQEKPADSSAACFYKMINSDYISWFDKLGWIGSDDIPNVEHHIYCFNDGIFEVISDYEPEFIVKTK